MSIYAVHKVAHQVQNNAAFREQVKHDPEGALAGFRLTEQERRALLTGDVGSLAQLGAHGYLLGHMARHGVFGLTMENYVQRIHDPGGVQA